MPSRTDIREAIERASKPVGLRDISKSLRLDKKKLSSALGMRLKAMVRDGQLIQNKKLKYEINRYSELVSGSVLAHRDGYAFVRPVSGGLDIYLRQKEARAVFHGDKVLVKVTDKDRESRPSGKLVEVLERGAAEFIGEYFEEKSVAYVKAKDRRISQKIFLKQKLADVVNGVLVNVVIVTQPTKFSDPIGEVKEILGDDLSARVEVDIVIRKHQLPYKWPKAVETEVGEIAGQIEETEFVTRHDLRDLAFVTIDGADARDFDDAVFVQSAAENKKLYVAIADVSHYVLPESYIDIEAKNRGTSVYFPDRVVPMLPEELSNGICSLVPDEDRLVLVCEMVVTPAGKIVSSEFYSGIICSHARLIYEDVQDWLDGDEHALGTASVAVKNNLLGLHQVFNSFKKAKHKRGALEIGTVEPKFTLNSRGEIKNIEASVRVDAHKIIEECMIAANTVAANFLLEKNSSSLFRVHELPGEDKVRALAVFLKLMGIDPGFSEKLESRQYASILKIAKDRKDRRVIETMVLRSLKLAAYSEKNSGHFGLGLDSYTHFTSPIRRYPDLIVHRAIKSGEGAYDKKSIEEMALQCSNFERRAELASRDVIAYLKCQYMRDKVGKEFSGLVTATTDFGLFVELADIFIEGLVHVTSLPSDYYVYSEAAHSLRGRKSGAIFSLGQLLKVVVSGVSVDERKIDLVISKTSKEGVKGNRDSVSFSQKARRSKSSTKKKKKNNARS